MLVASEQRLRVLVGADAEEADRNDDHARLLKCARLYPLLGLHYQGLVLYAQVMRRMLAAVLVKQSKLLFSLLHAYHIVMCH
jgi:hypothetical protein